MRREQLKAIRKPELINQLINVGDDNLKFKRINTKLQTDIKELKRKNGIANNKVATIRQISGDTLLDLNKKLEIKEHKNVQLRLNVESLEKANKEIEKNNDKNHDNYSDGKTLNKEYSYRIKELTKELDSFVIRLMNEEKEKEHIEFDLYQRNVEIKSIRELNVSLNRQNTALSNKLEIIKQLISTMGKVVKNG